MVVALLAARAEVRYHPAKVSPGDVARAISELGFPTEVLRDTGAAQQALILGVSSYLPCFTSGRRSPVASKFIPALLHKWT